MTIADVTIYGSRKRLHRSFASFVLVVDEDLLRLNRSPISSHDKVHSSTLEISGFIAYAPYGKSAPRNFSSASAKVLQTFVQLKVVRVLSPSPCIVLGLPGGCRDEGSLLSITNLTNAYACYHSTALCHEFDVGKWIWGGNSEG